MKSVRAILPAIPHPPGDGRRPGSFGFTLIEVLVAVVILSLIVLLMSDIATSALSTASRGKQDIEAIASARPLEQTLLKDLEQMVTADGQLPPFPQDGSGASRLAFFTAASSPASASDRPLTLVEYFWDASKAQLSRASRAYDWDSPPPFGQTPPSLDKELFPPIDGVLAFSVTFQDAAADAQPVFDAATSRYVRIGWVQCSPETLRILSTRGILTGVIDDLELAPGSKDPFFSFWNNRIDELVAGGTLSADLSSGLQIVQIIQPLKPLN